MAIGLRVKNFQSYEECAMEIDGLTVVVGSSNLGKSALQRALRGLIRNTLNGNQVRTGTKEMEVEANINGTNILVTRTKKDSPTYVIDGGEPYAKLNGVIPQELEDLNLGRIEIGGVKLDPIVSPQFGSPFMLEATAQQLNSILGAFSSTERLEAGKRRSNGQIAERNAQAKEIAAQMQECHERKDKLEKLVTRADAIQATIDLVEPRVRRQERIIEQVEFLIEHLTRLNHLKSVLDKVEVPDTEPVAHKIDLVEAFGTAAVVCQSHNTLRSILDRLTIPDPKPVIRRYNIAGFADEAADALKHKERAEEAYAAIEVCATAWTQIVAKYNQGKAYRELQEALEAASTSKAKRYLAMFDTNTGSLEGMIQAVKQKLSIVSMAMVTIPAMVSLQKMREALEAAQLNVTQAQADEREAQAALNHAREEELARLQAKAANQKTINCPHCGEALAV